MSNDQLSTGIQLIIRDLHLEEHQDALMVKHEDELVQKLTKIIRYLLDHNFEFLLTAFYRIDLDEKVVNKVLHEEAPENIASTLAKKVVEREMLKAKYRLKYKA